MPSYGPLNPPISDELLDKYAELIVRYGINVQPGQMVHITSETAHLSLARKVLEKAYKAGALFVNVDLTDPYLQYHRMASSSDEGLRFVPGFIKARFDEITTSHGATLRIDGSEDPEILSGLDSKRVNTARAALRRAAQKFYDDGVERAQVHWCVAGAPTRGWASKVFPSLSPDDAFARLWSEVVKILRLDKPDPVAAWHEHNAKLKARCKALHEMKVRELHFVGPGTDLKVALDPLARFKGGTEPGPRGVDFEPNLPTEECFSIPDCRKTHGSARATRPFLINGTMIENLQMHFKNGLLVDFSCSAGESTLREYLATDEGARRLGEVALVGIDSPVYQSGVVFREILFDENAACHVAIGMAYRHCLEGGEKMSEQELRDHGCNQSIVHTDIMISSEEVSVIATKEDGTQQTIIDRGAWMM